MAYLLEGRRINPPTEFGFSRARSTLAWTNRGLRFFLISRIAHAIPRPQAQLALDVTQEAETSSVAAGISMPAGVSDMALTCSATSVVRSNTGFIPI